jgi:hypothetical protein
MSASAAVLCGREGALVSVSIAVDPRHLESLLEALAQLDFPINPQIYHDAALVYRFADGREQAASTTLVEFPAYEERLAEVRRAVEAFGFDPDSVHVTGMLDEIHADGVEEPAPAGAPYVTCLRVKRRQ